MYPNRTRIRWRYAAGVAAGVAGTPTIFVGCKGGKLQNVTTPGAAPTLQDTTQAIDAAACS